MSRRLALLAAAVLASEGAHPVRNDLGSKHRSALRILANTPTTKRAKVKAARKQRNRK